MKKELSSNTILEEEHFVNTSTNEKCANDGQENSNEMQWQSDDYQSSPDISLSSFSPNQSTTIALK